METIIQSGKIEEILGSLDAIKRAEAPAFLFERIQAKLTAERTSSLGKIKRTFPIPAFAITIVPFIMLLDLAALQLQEKRNSITIEYNWSRISSENDLDEAVFYTGPETADAFDLGYY